MEAFQNPSCIQSIYYCRARRERPYAMPETFAQNPPAGVRENQVLQFRMSYGWKTGIRLD